ncbi:MAG: FGGY-family carbohydrate kinase [Spirochaetales bacterium]|nr:FGGY-family carbohydrate kinase [Spirochaetales bacterium]
MVVGIDVGTGSVKAVLGIDQKIETVSVEYPAEINSELPLGLQRVSVLTGSFKILLSEIARISEKSGEPIQGICLCGHGPSLVVVQNAKTGEYLDTWQNNRARKEAEELGEIFPGFAKDGTSFEAKVFYYWKHNPECFKKDAKVLYPKDFLIFLLTGEMIIDHSTASTLEFFDPDSSRFQTGDSGIPEKIFPRVVKSWDEAGLTGTLFSRSCRISDGIPVFAGGIDAWCEALGAGAFKVGDLVDGTGTSTCLTRSCTAFDSPLVHVIPDRSIRIETMSSTGAAVKWLCQLLDTDLQILNQRVESDRITPLPILNYPYLNGERSPLWDERASLSVTGLTGENNTVELYQSLLQGIAFGFRQCLDLVLHNGELSSNGPIRAVGGGARNRALVQLKADISGESFQVMKEKDAAPLGAMLLVAKRLSGESWENCLSQWVKVDRLIEPNPEYQKIWEELFAEYVLLHQQQKESLHRLYEMKMKMSNRNKE